MGVLILRKLSFLQAWLGQESVRPGAKHRCDRDIFPYLCLSHPDSGLISEPAWAT